MHSRLQHALGALALLLGSSLTLAAPALEVLGRDFIFPNQLEGLPAKLSGFKALQITQFETSDGVKLSYWEAGSGQPLVFIPGWSANGAEFINVMYLLSKHYHVYVIDPRNQGLSQQVNYGGHIARYAMDLKEFSDHLGLKSADVVGWSMGAAVLWSYIDLFGSQRLHKAVFVDEPVSIYAHADWTEQQRLDAGGMTSSVERMVAAFTRGGPSNQMVVDMKVIERAMAKDSPYYVNSEAFANAFIKTNPEYSAKVLFDHASNDWSDVIRNKIRLPVAIFSGEYSNNLPSQRWIASVIPNARLYAYTREQQGDHFLMFKNPFKFTQDLRNFLEHG